MYVVLWDLSIRLYGIVLYGMASFWFFLASFTHDQTTKDSGPGCRMALPSVCAYRRLVFSLARAAGFLSRDLGLEPIDLDGTKRIPESWDSNGEIGERQKTS
jgi:hypothetical protein